VLKRVKDAGEITIGVRDASIPFSYLDDKQQAVGYSVDLCLAVVADVKSQLKLPGLKISYNPVTSATRIPLTPTERCRSNAVRPSPTPSASGRSGSASRLHRLTKFVAKRPSNSDARRSQGKTVACTAGTNTLARVNELNQKNALGLTILTGKDHAESFLMVQTDRAAAFFEDDILLAGIVANSPRPDDYAIGTEAYSIDPYALMLPRGDDAFKRLVDATLTRLYRSGDIQRLYEKWFLRPIPPKGMTLNFPQSAALKRAFEKPTDSPDPAAYQ
jgi:glutamate/aspartate transport system substrate-binding protein